MLGAIALLLAQTLSPVTAQAVPSAEVLRMIEESYNPSMKIRETSAGYSLSGCRLSELELAVEDPVTRGPGWVRARIYQASGSAPRSIILLPPTGGENLMDKGYANALCSAGFRVILLREWAHDTEALLDLGMHDRNALRALAAVRHVLDYLRPAANEPVGILGTSVGALTSSLALQFDPRLKAAVLIVGGVGMPEIIAKTTEQGAAKLRAERMRHFGFRSPEEYLAALERNVKIEPADFAGHSGAKKILAVVGKRDVTVPTHLQRELVRRFGAQAIEHEGDHMATILWAFWNQCARFTSFFREALR